MAVTTTVQKAREAKSFHRAFLFDMDVLYDLNERFTEKFQKGLMTPMLTTKRGSIVHHIALDFDIPVSICGMKGTDVRNRMGGALVNTVCPVCTVRWTGILRTFLRDCLAEGKYHASDAMKKALLDRNPYRFLNHFINR